MKENSAKEYFKLSYQRGSDIWTHTPWQEAALEILPELTDNLVLDIGCGRGIWLESLMQKNITCIGVDYIPEIIENINQKIHQKYRPEIARAILADARNLPFTNNSFNIITDRGVFQHLQKSDQNTYIKEIARNLKKDGYYLNISLSSNTESFLGFSPKHDHIYEQEKFGTPFHFFSPKLMTELFQKDFEIISQTEHTYPSQSDPMDTIHLLFSLMKKK